ncbi:MAG TPA: RNA-guided endonuclease TnpB family protein [Pseudonocardiaceae bacterium]
MGRHTAFRFTLDAPPEQVVALTRHAGAARFAYNQSLRLVKDALSARAADCSVEVPWSGFDLINAFNGWKVSAAAGRVLVADAAGEVTVVATGLAWRSAVHQQVFEEAAVDLGRALAGYRASRRGQRGGRRVGFPRFKRKDRDRRSFRIRQKTHGGRGSIRVGEADARSVTLPRIGVLRVREDTRRLRRMLRTGRASIVFATVSYRAGRWTVALTLKAADLHPARQHPPRRDGHRAGWVGVDRGLSAYVVAATTTGREVAREDDPPRPLRTARGRLRRLSRQVSRKKKGSANRVKAAARLGRAYARVRDVRQEFLHEVANKLVKTHDRLAWETLNITGMMKNHRLAGAIGDAAWGQLGRIMAYKQTWRGGQWVPVDRWFPSTRTCSRCHTLAATMPLSARTFHCGACGYRADRDLNAAVNLAVWAEQHHAQTRDLDARGLVINAPRGDGSDPHHRVGETSPDDGRTRPPHPPRVPVAGTPEKGGGP